MINDLVDGGPATSNNSNNNNSTIFGTTTNPNNGSLAINNELLFANATNNISNGQGSLDNMSPESMAALAASFGLAAPPPVQLPLVKGQQNGEVGASSLLNGQQQQQCSLEYLAQLLKDKKSLNSLPNIFLHVERLIDDEISRVRSALFHAELSTKEALVLPEPIGNVVMLQEKIYVPVKDYPDYNFVGRILGPRGMTAKQLEQETGCKIMVRGKGSMRDKKKEDANRGKPNWEHLNDELHVLLQCEDTENRAALKLKRGCEELRKLLMPAPEGEDDLKRKQLMELAIINGTFRTQNQNKTNLQTQLLSTTPMTAAVAAQNALRAPTLGAPIYLTPGGARLAAAAAAAASPATAQSLAAAAAGFPSLNFDLNAAAAAAGLILPIDQVLSLSSAFPYSAAATLNPQLFAGDYISADSQAGAILNQRRLLNQAREHPYQRPNA